MIQITSDFPADFHWVSMQASDVVCVYGLARIIHELVKSVRQSEETCTALSGKYVEKPGLLGLKIYTLELNHT